MSQAVWLLFVSTLFICFWWAKGMKLLEWSLNYVTYIPLDEEWQRSIFSEKLEQRHRELSFKYLRQSKEKKFSAHLCTLWAQRRSVSLYVFARSLFRIGRGSTCFSHRKRIDLFFAISFCPSDHFTSAAEWQKFTRIGLGFAPDRLFCL